jgi:hypothetical protein
VPENEQDDADDMLSDPPVFFGGSVPLVVETASTVAFAPGIISSTISSPLSFATDARDDAAALLALISDVDLVITLKLAFREAVLPAWLSERIGMPRPDEQDREAEHSTSLGSAPDASMASWQKLRWIELRSVEDSELQGLFAGSVTFTTMVTFGDMISSLCSWEIGVGFGVLEDGVGVGRGSGEG